MTDIFLSTSPVRGTTASPSSFFHAISFLSTYPVRGTTWMASRRGFSTLYFYPRTPCGVRPSIRMLVVDRFVFLSTYPVRGTTEQSRLRLVTDGISIHVPRAGYDDVSEWQKTIDWEFLSTYPVRGTTIMALRDWAKLYISIHVPRAGYDLRAYTLRARQ